MATNLFAGLRRIAELFFLRLEGEQVNTEHPDPVQLKQAYRDLTNLGALVDTVAGFIFAGGIKVESEDEEASAVCDEFNDRNEEELQTAVRESCLYGFTWLLPFWSVSDSEGPCSSLRVYSPSAVQLLTSETSDPSDSSDPSDLPRAIITSTINLRRTVQTITPTTWRIEVNGRQTQSGPNPLGMIPIVPVHLGRFSDDLFGSSVISDALYQTLREKAILRKKGISLERRQSTLLAVNGRATVDVLKPKLDRISGDSPAIPTVFLQDPKGSVNFVESRRGPEGIIELLQLLYHDAIVDGKIPEYLLGVGMPSAQASTKEQRAKVEALVTPLRSSWKKGLRQLNRIVLKLHELHEIRSFVTDVTSVSFGPLFEKDESAAADTLNKKSDAMLKLNSVGILSRETAQESIPELIPDVEREKQRLASERAESEPYPNPPPTNPPAPTDQSNPSEEPAPEAP
jgi:hypothetical protein